VISIFDCRYYVSAILRSIVAEDKPGGEQHLPLFVNTNYRHSLSSDKTLCLLAYKIIIREFRAVTQ